jgi:hypothetical protein
MLLFVDVLAHYLIIGRRGPDEPNEAHNIIRSTLERIFAEYCVKKAIAK